MAKTDCGKRDPWGWSPADYVRAQQAVAEARAEMARWRSSPWLSAMAQRYREEAGLGTRDYETEADRMGE